MGKQQKKRGFTIVELVIVIGVIGILAGILIPTFINLNKKAQDSSDTSFAKNANTALAMGHRRHKTMSEAIADVVANSDISVDDFRSSAGNILVWDSEADRFAIVDEAEGVNKVIYAEGGALKATKNSQLFRIYDDFNFALGQRYSIYASKNWNLANAIIGDDTHPLTVGFDVGINDHFVSGHYERPSDAEAQSVILNTGDCSALAFEVNSPKDTLSHFGNADNIHITAIASASYHEWGAVTEPVVIESGRIVLESGSDVTATVMGGATAEKAAGSASSVEYVDHTPGSISSYRFPAFVQEYLARTDKSRLDSILDIQTTPEPNRNNYYRNDDLTKGSEGGADSYKVGNDNAFPFPIYAIEVNSTTLVETVYKNPNGVEPVITRTEGSGNLTWNEDKELDPTAANVGDKFNIALGSNVFSVEIVDGYNITDAKGLSLADNVASIVDNDGNLLARYDNWADKKIELFGDDYYTLRPAALIQHGDIKLKNTDLPDEMFWSAQDVEDYLAKYPEDLKGYIDTHNGPRAALGLPLLTESDLKRLLSGSMRDDTTVFYRATGNYLLNFGTPDFQHYNAQQPHETYFEIPGDWNGNFVFEGNYFKIDISSIKQIAFFGVHLQKHKDESRITPQNPEEMPRLATDITTLAGEVSHGALFGFNTVGGYSKNDLLPYRGWGGRVDFNNLTVIGNGNRANDTKYQGGLYAFKVDGAEAYFNNINVSKTMTAFMSQIGFYKQNSFKTEMHIDRCKSFDSYNFMFYIYGTEDNYMTNSCAKNAGGPLFILDEHNRYLEFYEAITDKHPSGAGDHCGYVGDAPTLISENVFFENYILGTEPFFATKPKDIVDALVGQSKGYGAILAQAGKKSYLRDNFGDGQTYMNVIAMSMDIGGVDNIAELLSNPSIIETEYKYASPARARFEINNGEDLAKKVDMNFSSEIFTKYMENCNAKLNPMGEGMIFENSLGGHARSTTPSGTEAYSLGTIDLNGDAKAQDPVAWDDSNGLADGNYIACYWSKAVAVPSIRSGFVFGMK